MNYEAWNCINETCSINQENSSNISLQNSQTQSLTTSTSLLNLCTNPDHLRQIHAKFILQGLHQNPSLTSKLMDSCSKFSHLKFTMPKLIFHSTTNPDFDLYKSFLRILCNISDFKDALLLYRELLLKCLYLDEYTYPYVIKSCTLVNDIKNGKVIHGHAVKLGLTSCDELVINTALLTMYAKLGHLADARMLFDRMTERDIVVWNIMISGYSQHGFSEDVLDLLRDMAGKSVLKADMFSVIPAVYSISALSALELGKEMHCYVTRNNVDSQVSVFNSMIDMYCKCGQLDYARRVFDMVVDRSVVTWSSIIKGYVSHDRNYEALSLFVCMKFDGIGADWVTLINLLPACVDMGALEQVKYLHGYSTKCGMDSVSSLNTAFSISYAKCGCIEMARKLFDEDEIDSKDIIMWNSMISAHAKHGEGPKCFELYNQMKKSDVKPDGVTFLALLTACVNSGCITEGWGFFIEMTETYGFGPSQEHYASMVDLLGRAGHINEARELIKTMPMKPDARVWGPLLSACKLHRETELAEYAAEELLSLEPENAGNFILLSNIYASAGKWDRVAKMRRFLRDKGLKKTTGVSWLDINGRVHEFSVADRSHQRSEDILSILGCIEFEINVAGCKGEPVVNV